jgi:hypothetical protein
MRNFNEWLSKMLVVNFFSCFLIRGNLENANVSKENC